MAGTANFTADPARIRLSVRDAEYARVSNPAILVQRPAASDGFAQIREGFFDTVADAQVLLNELATQLAGDRRREAAETDTQLQIGVDIPLTPAIPRVRMIDSSTGLDRTMFIKGVAVDLQTDRNAIEAIG